MKLANKIQYSQTSKKFNRCTTVVQLSKNRGETDKKPIKNC